jgi:ribose transport system ATP-binding protein
MSVLKVQEVSKFFPGTRALNRVNFELDREGEIHALVGENGAGKTTLVKIINGALEKNEGAILLRGEPYHASNVQQAQQQGLAFIPQASNLIGCLSVRENLFLGQEHVKGSLIKRIDWKKSGESAARLLTRVGLGYVNIDMHVEDFEVAEQQLIEIAKVLSIHASIITMDEPTSSLTEEETRRLFDIIRFLQRMNVSVIFVSHKLDEVFHISDKITVLRNGECVGTRNTPETSREEIVRMMTGREEAEKYSKKKGRLGSVLMKVRNLKTRGIVHEVSFELAAGETLAIAGLLGSGQTELLETMCGYYSPISGSIEIDGREIRIHSPKDALRHGIGYIPEDRHVKGLMLNQSVQDNISAASLRDDRHFGLLSIAVQLNRVQKLIVQLGIVCAGTSQLVENLSGGNQQKVLLARYLKAKPRILLLNEPTRGIDVGAKTEIYNLISSFKEEGGAVLMVSSELPEILGISDRIMVMHEGRVTGFFSTGEATKEKLMHAMTD